jgi:hypothetical protein
MVALRFRKKVIQRALKLSDVFFYELEIDGGGFDGGVSQ